MRSKNMISRYGEMTRRSLTEGNVPIGTVLAFAGPYDESFESDFGLLLCDGSAKNISQYKELFAVLGTSNGGDGASSFNLPNYQGMFLRGRDRGTGRDPDANTRTAPTSTGGDQGDTIGSCQGYATAIPYTPFTQEVSHLPSGGTHQVYSGTNRYTCRDTSGARLPVEKGGDAESRPVNVSVNFLIKAKPASGAYPAGSMVFYSGVIDMFDDWLLCKGTAYMNIQYPELYARISTNNGGDGNQSFNAPDFRGRFLRGTSNGTGRDPDADDRIQQTTGGISGDQAGSLQNYATAVAAGDDPLLIDFPHLPQDDYHTTACAGHTMARWNGDNTTIQIESGGDNESRPVNLAVDAYIAKKDCLQSQIPIGAIIAYAGVGNSSGTRPDSSQWLLCDGSEYSLQDDDYKILGAIIGSVNGGDGASKFNVPDLRGRFIRGTNYGADGELHDPDADDRTAAASGGASGGGSPGTAQSFATGLPQNPFEIDVSHLPDDDTQTADVWFSAPDCLSWEGGSNQASSSGGGDVETRPVNIYVDFYIKYA